MSESNPGSGGKQAFAFLEVWFPNLCVLHTLYIVETGIAHLCVILMNVFFILFVLCSDVYCVFICDNIFILCLFFLFVSLAGGAVGWHLAFPYLPALPAPKAFPTLP